MKLCHLNFQFLLIFLIHIKCGELSEESNSDLQKLEKVLAAVTDICHLTKDFDVQRMLDSIRNDCSKKENHEVETEYQETGKDVIANNKTSKDRDSGQADKPSNCADIQLMGFNTNGIYEVFPNKDEKSFKVYCDFKTNGGGWTVFQRRGDFGIPKENFFRNWNEYKLGFGDLNKQFWLGNEKLFLLTRNTSMIMRIDMEDHNNIKKYAKYTDFVMEGEDKSYKMNYRDYSGDAGDSLAYHRGRSFVTYDKDNDGKCSENYKGGWWYYGSGCYTSNLNGLYFSAQDATTWECMNWSTFTNSWAHCLKYTEMKVKPQNFMPMN